MYIKTHLKQLKHTIRAIRALVPESVIARLVLHRKRSASDTASGHPTAGPAEDTTPEAAAAAPSATGCIPEPQVLPGSAAGQSGAGVILGTDLTTGHEVTISPLAHTGWILGAPGTGKTTLLANLILDDIRQGRCIGLIEPHGDLTQTIIAGIPQERLKDIVYLSVEDWEYPFGLNLFECPPNSTLSTKAAVASCVAHAFEKIWGLGALGTETPRLMQNIRAVTRTLIDNPGTTIAEAPLLYAFEPVRRRLLSHVQNPQMHLYWEQYAQKTIRDREFYTESTLNKINAFLDEPMIRNILAQAKTTFNWREILDTGKILLIKLSPQFEEASTLVGSIVIAQLLLTAFSRADTPEENRRPFHLYCDEFQRFATSNFSTMINEYRKFSIRPFMSHQSVAQLDAATRASLAAAGLLVVFRVSGEEGKAFLARNFDTTPTKKVVIGTEPIRAPVSDIVGHLVRRGHTHPVVSAFTTEYLSPLETFLQQVRHNPHPFEFGSSECRTGHLLEGRRLLNDALFACMQSGRSDGPVHPWALFVLTGAANDGSSRVLKPHMKETLFSGAAFLGTKESAFALGAADFLADERMVNWLLKRFGRQRWWDSLSECRYVYPGQAFIRLHRALRSTIEILAAEPVLVDTGQYRDKYQLQTYQDVENEIGNFLSSGLGNYEAKVKIVTKEYTIRTRPAPVVLSGDALTERLEAIRRQMRERGYTRPYEDVAAEIRARYALYRGLAEAPPPHQAAGNGAARARPSGGGAGDKARPSPPPPPPGSAFSSGRGD